MIILDRMLVGSIKFVFGKLVAAAEAERNDDSALRERLLAAQMQFELGEMSEEEFASIEAEVLARLREIREEREGGSAPLTALSAQGGGDFKIAGIEASFSADEEYGGGPVNEIDPKASIVDVDPVAVDVEVVEAGAAGEGDEEPAAPSKPARRTRKATTKSRPKPATRKRAARR